MVVGHGASIPPWRPQAAVPGGLILTPPLSPKGVELFLQALGYSGRIADAVKDSKERWPMTVGRLFLQGVVLPCLVLAAWLSPSAARAETPPAAREIWTLVRSEFALAAQAAATKLGNLAGHLPLPSCDTAPVVDGELEELVWGQATEVPLPCVGRAQSGRIVTEARLLALRAKERLFLALVFPHKAVTGSLLTIEMGTAHKLTVSLEPDGKVTASPDKVGKAGPWGLRSAAARRGESITVELELAWPEGEIVLRPSGDVLGLRPPHPLANVQLRFSPADFAWRLKRGDEAPGRHSWRLETNHKPLSAAASYASVRGFGAAAATGQGEVSAGAGSALQIQVPAAIGATLLKITAPAPRGGSHAFVCATYVPDLPLLLARTKALAADQDLRPARDFRPRLKEIEERSFPGPKQLGTRAGQRSWDEAFRAAARIRRELVLSSRLLDFERLVFVKRPHFGGHDGFFGYTSYLKRSPAELCVLESVRQGQPVRTLLRTETGCVRDPDVSFDGRRVLFAWARDQKDSYHLYEINADGNGLRQLTTSPPYSGPEPAPRGVGFQDVEPCYLPSGDIAFTSTRYVRYVDCVGQGEPVTTLFVMNKDGQRMRGISANHVHDWNPSVLNDGRIVFTRWEYTDRSQMWSHQLFAKNPDGSGTTAFYGSNSWWPVSMLHARAVPGSEQVVCTLAGHHSGTEQAGEIALIDRRRGTEETGGVVALFPPRKIAALYEDVPRPANAFYSEPYPLSGRHFLVSGRPPGCERFGLYLADFHGNWVLLYEDDRLDALSPMPLAPRPKPPVIQPQTDYRQDTGLVSLIDIYRGPGLAGIKRGTVKALRLVDFDLRDTPETGGLRQENGPSGGHSCPVSALGGSWHVKRILGTVPVHEDGSAFFRIPAERRVSFQPLDEKGRALQAMRSWVELMPGEKVTCVGCHERPLQAPPNELTSAHRQGPVDPKPWYGPPRAFGFPREVQPLLERHCTRCHNQRDPKGLDLRGDATNWFSLAYENLRPFVNPVGPQSPPALLPPRSVGAIASPLVDLLLKGHYDVKLDAESLDRLITWIDFNVPYYDNTAVTRPAGAFGNSSGRALVGDKDARVLWAALGKRCAACHPAGFRVDPAGPPCQVSDLPRTMQRPCLNLTHPEQSRLLTAPLAKTAGGLELCQQMVFANRDDPTYQAALKVIQGWHHQLLARPREDMPGAVPCAAYTATLLKREAWLRLEREHRRALGGQ